MESPITRLGKTTKCVIFLSSVRELNSKVGVLLVRPDQNYFRKAAEVYEKITSIHQGKRALWISDVAFTWQWWLGVGLAIVPWVIWILLRKKESTYRLLTAGFFVIVMCSWLDVIGITLGLWHYNFDVVPMMPSYLPWDFTLLPVLVMSFIQYKPKMSPIIKAIVCAAISAFVGEPVSQWLRLYDPHNWKSIYSFPILIVIYLIAHFISSRKEFKEIA